MSYLHKQSQRHLILIERQGRFGLFTEYGEPGCAKIPMEAVEPALDENTLGYLSRA